VKIKGNAARADMQDAARIAGVDVTVNCTYNHHRQLIGLHVGDVDDAWHDAIKFCYHMHSAPHPSHQADVVVVNAYPIANQGIDWSGARASLKQGGHAIAISQHPWGFAAVHYHEERNWWWARQHGYPHRSWPVSQAQQVTVYTTRVTMKEKLQYSDKVEWVTSWPKIIQHLTLNGEGTSALVYHNKLQFNPDTAPLIL